jgi:protein kinase A
MLDKNNKNGYGKSVDYWGIGILIYELLAGYPPFYDNDEPKNIYKKILKGVI